MKDPRVYSLTQVSRHSSCESLWVIYKDKIYDITEFLFDHPGGQDILLQYGGRRIDKVISDDSIHSHSTLAFSMLAEYQIGSLESDGSDIVPDEDDSIQLSTQFIDITKPMLMQVFNSSWTKAFYLEQVHISRHSKTSAPIFGSPFLEPFTKTSWYVVPLVWLPVSAFFFQLSIATLASLATISFFCIGVILWTLIEYTLHRFLFHMEDALPPHRIAFSLHFISHGIHHLLPMDRNRLVMPPALLAILSLPIVSSYFALFSTGYAAALTSGGYAGYVAYDMMHYYLHHGIPMGDYAKGMKSYHLDHHYKQPSLGFGITSKGWDVIFGTLLQ